MSWLDNLSPRERALIGIMVAVASLFVVWQFAVSPMIQSREAAEANRASAMRDLDIVRRAAPALGQGAMPSKAAFDRSIIIARARAAGITISRVQPGRDGVLQIWFDDASAPALMTLLRDMTTGYNVDIIGADIARRDNGRVSAQITLRPIT